MNESGQSSFLGLFFLMAITVLALSLIKVRLTDIQKLKNKQNLLLCSKIYNGELKSLTQKISVSDDYLKILTIGKEASILIPIPGLNIAVRNGKKAAIKTLKAYQEALHFSFLKKTSSLMRKNCKFLNLLSITPYKTNLAMVLRRNMFNQTILKRRRWKQKFYNGGYLIRSRYSLPNLRIQSKINEVNFFSKFL